MVLEFPYNDKYYVKSFMWIPEGHPKINFYKSKGWIDNNEIIVTQGNAIDFKTVRDRFVFYSKERLNPKILVKALRNESEVKKLFNNKNSIGF